MASYLSASRRSYQAVRWFRPSKNTVCGDEIRRAPFPGGLQLGLKIGYIVVPIAVARSFAEPTPSIIDAWLSSSEITASSGRSCLTDLYWHRSRQRRGWCPPCRESRYAPECLMIPWVPQMNQQTPAETGVQTVARLSSHPDGWLIQGSCWRTC